MPSAGFSVGSFRNYPDFIKNHHEKLEKDFLFPPLQEGRLTGLVDVLAIRRHASREDTVLFPEFRKIVPPREFGEPGEEFEKREDKSFGENGFSTVVGRVEAIGKKLGIFDIQDLTPVSVL